MTWPSTFRSIPIEAARMGGRPKLAGVIPAFNSAKVVSQAIESLQQQTIPLDEIIVVDDGSSDDTAAVAARAGVVVIKQVNRGPGAARNAAIRATDADWIVLLDADDIAYPGRVAVQLEHLHNPDIAVVCGNGQEGSDSEVTHQLLWTKNRVTTSTVSLRRVAWEAVGGFTESQALIGVEDYNLWLRLTWNGWKVVRLGNPLARYRPGETSLSKDINRFVKAELENVKVLQEEFKLSPETVRAKEHTVFLHYGLDTFHERNFPSAREYLSQATRLGALSLPNHLRLWISQLLSPVKSLRQCR